MGKQPRRRLAARFTGGATTVTLNPDIQLSDSLARMYGTQALADLSVADSGLPRKLSYGIKIFAFGVCNPAFQNIIQAMRDEQTQGAGRRGKRLRSGRIQS